MRQFFVFYLHTSFRKSSPSICFELNTFKAILQLLILFQSLNIWFQSSKNMKIYSIIQQQQNDVEEITISTIYKEMMMSSEKDHWIIIMNSEIKKHHQQKLFMWVSRSKKIRIL